MGTRRWSATAAATALAISTVTSVVTRSRGNRRLGDHSTKAVTYKGTLLGSTAPRPRCTSASPSPPAMLRP